MDKRVCGILFKVWGIVGIFTAMIIVAASVVLIVLGAESNYDFIRKGLENHDFTTSYQGTLDEQTVYVQRVLSGAGALLAMIAILVIISCVLAFIASKKENKELYIACLVIGAIIGNIVLILAAAVSLNELNKKEKEEYKKLMQEEEY